jgi:hypothetical protein
MLFFGKNNPFVAGIMEEDDERAGFRGIKRRLKIANL